MSSLPKDWGGLIALYNKVPLPASECTITRILPGEMPNASSYSLYNDVLYNESDSLVYTKRALR